MEVKRLVTNICSQDLASSKRFYTSLFAFKVGYDSDWFIHLISEGTELELGIILENHTVVPVQVQSKISGAYLTFVVKDVDVLYQTAKELDCNILQPPENTFYGQRRMLLVAPEGTVCDVSSPIKA